MERNPPRPHPQVAEIQAVVLAIMQEKARLQATHKEQLDQVKAEMRTRLQQVNSAALSRIWPEDHHSVMSIALSEWT